MSGLAITSAIAASATEPIRHITQNNIVFEAIDNVINKPILNVFKLNTVDPIQGLSKDVQSWILIYLLTLVVLKYALILPDVDSKDSILGRYVPFIEDTFGHRTIFHTIIPILILAFSSLFLFKINIIFGQVFLILSIGYTFHLIEDSWSYQGINWFLIPIKSKLKLPRYKVGGKFESTIYYISLVILILSNIIIAYAIIA